MHAPLRSVIQGHLGVRVFYVEHPTVIPMDMPPSPQSPSGSMTRAHRQATVTEVTSLHSELPLNSLETWVLPHAWTLCILRHAQDDHGESKDQCQSWAGEKQGEGEEEGQVLHTAERPDYLPDNPAFCPANPATRTKRTQSPSLKSDHPRPRPDHPEDSRTSGQCLFGKLSRKQFTYAHLRSIWRCITGWDHNCYRHRVAAEEDRVNVDCWHVSDMSSSYL